VVAMRVEDSEAIDVHIISRVYSPFVSLLLKSACFVPQSSPRGRTCSIFTCCESNLLLRPDFGLLQLPRSCHAPIASELQRCIAVHWRSSHVSRQRRSDERTRAQQQQSQGSSGSRCANANRPMRGCVDH
jgi:hypothetical protein